MLPPDPLESRHLLAAAPFGDHGVALVNLPGGEDTLPLHALAPGGKIVLAGRAKKGFAIVRLNADGSRDTSFDGDGVRYFNTTIEWSQLTVDPASGRIALFDQKAEATRVFLATGAFDAQWGANGFRATRSLIEGVDLSAASVVYGAVGRLLLVSFVYKGAGTSQSSYGLGVAAFGRDASPDAAYGEAGLTALVTDDFTDGSLEASVSNDGTLTIFNTYRYGYYPNPDEPDRLSSASESKVVRFSATGNVIGGGLSERFATAAGDDETTYSQSIVSRVAVSSRVAAQLTLTTYREIYDPEAFRPTDPSITVIDDSGSKPKDLYLSFVPSELPLQLAQTSDGYIYLVRQSTSVGTTVTRYKTDLTVDTTWAAGGTFLSRTPVVGEVFVNTDGTLLIAGTVKQPDGTTAAALARLELTAPIPAAATAAILAGRVLDIRGTAAADAITVRRKRGSLFVTINATEQTFAAADVLAIDLDAGGGDDRVFSKMDTLRPYLTGGAGNDYLSGGPVGVVAYGGEGNDRLDAAGNANSLLFGEDGDDRLNGAGGRDSLFGGLGADTLYGNEDDDSLDGGSGPDRLFGGAGRDDLNGGGSIDRLYGGPDNDTLHGGDAADFLFGQAGGDFLDGGIGDDFIDGGAGIDNYYRYDNDRLVDVEV